MAEAGYGRAEGRVTEKWLQGPPCAGVPDMGARGSKAQSLWPFAVEAAVSEQTLVSP